MQTMAGGRSAAPRAPAYAWIQLHYELDYHLNGNKREMLKYTATSFWPATRILHRSLVLSLSLSLFRHCSRLCKINCAVILMLLLVFSSYCHPFRTNFPLKILSWKKSSIFSGFFNLDIQSFPESLKLEKSYNLATIFLYFFKCKNLKVKIKVKVKYNFQSKNHFKKVW